MPTSRSSAVGKLRSLLVGALIAAGLTGPALGGPDGGREAELMNLLVHDCGSCHGLTRKGGLGSPLVPEAIADRDDESLVQAILDGVPGTPMPPWRPLLKEGEAEWLVRTLREGVHVAD